jgi:hypothetical protein
MAFTKEQAALVHADIRAALEAVAAKHNLSMVKTHVLYSNEGFKFTGEFGDKNTLGDIDPILFKDMKRHGWKFGFAVEDIGKEFQSRGRTFKIEGMRGYTYVVAKMMKSNVSSDKVGGLFKFKGEDVKKLMVR